MTPTAMTARGAPFLIAASSTLYVLFADRFGEMPGRKSRQHGQGCEKSADRHRRPASNNDRNQEPTYSGRSRIGAIM